MRTGPAGLATEGADKSTRRKTTESAENSATSANIWKEESCCGKRFALGCRACGTWSLGKGGRFVSNTTEASASREFRLRKRVLEVRFESCSARKRP